jgi:hypothetical protein
MRGARANAIRDATRLHIFDTSVPCCVTSDPLGALFRSGCTVSVQAVAVGAAAHR